MSIEDFIGIFPNAASPEYCQSTIAFYERQETMRKTLSRQESDGVTPMEIQNRQYFMENVTNNLTEENIIVHTEVAGGFFDAIWKSHKSYVEKYGILASLNAYNTSSITAKIQRTMPSEGYHVWHCENGSAEKGRRLLLAMLYLNDVDEGGETEFLYQGIRVPPKQGTLVLCPAGFTHTHRGNPPLKSPKYIINTWLEFTK